MTQQKEPREQRPAHRHDAGRPDDAAIVSLLPRLDRREIRVRIGRRTVQQHDPAEHGRERSERGGLPRQAARRPAEHEPERDADRVAWGDPEKCVAAVVQQRSRSGASELRDYAKAQVKALGLAGKGRVRVNMAGCLDRCEEGPVIVVYPEDVWYTYVDRADIDEIIEEHVRNGRVVERLRL